MKILKQKKGKRPSKKEDEVYNDGRLSIEHCKKILQRHGKNYSDEQIREMRDLVFRLASIDYLQYLEQQKQDEQESISIRQSQHRRAS